MKCENCGNEHDGSYGSGRFCSDHCRRVYSGKHVNINGKQKCNFKYGKGNQKQKASYGTWKCKFCGIIFETRHQMELHIWKNHHPKYGLHGKGQVIWNKGFTKETSIIIANAVIKASKSLKGKRHFQSKATREKLSEIRSKYLDNCAAGFQNVKWYKIKNLNGIEYIVRGTWELNVANKLNNENIIWIRNYRLKYIKDGIQKTYNPDFYLPATNEFIEVKGYYSNKDKEKMKLVLEQNNIKIYFIDQYHYQNYIDGKIKLSDLLMK